MSALENLPGTSLFDLFVSDRDPRRLYAAGRLVRLRRGSYVPTDVWVGLTDEDRYRLTPAAHAWANPGSVYCAETALFLRDVPTVKTPPVIDVATASTTRLGLGADMFQVQGDSIVAQQARGLRPPRIRRHHHACLAPEAVGEYWTVPLAEALAETLATGKFARALTVADGVLRMDREVPLLDRTPVMDAIKALRHGTHRTRAEQIAMLAREGAESPGESVSRGLMLLLGFPEPALQREYSDALGLIGRTDFTWACGEPSLPTPRGKERVGEFDGMGKYFPSASVSGEGTASILKREKKRENRLLALGHPVLRWTWSELENPSRLRALLVAGGLRASRSAALAIKCA